MTSEEQTKLYIEYRGKVMSYIRTRVKTYEDAEDICSDVFEKVFRSGDRYDAEKASASTWIYTITRNAVIDYFRRMRPAEELPEELRDDEKPEDEVLRSETLDELAAALRRLPEELRDIIVLRYYDCMPLTEIAAQMGLSYGAVKIRHQKALNQLREAMDPGYRPGLRFI